MSTETLIYTMERLIKLHNSLYEVAIKKTDIVKKGDMDALNQTLKDEQAHIAAIQKLEIERQKMATAIVPRKDKPTIEDCLKNVNGSFREKLEFLRTELLEVVLQIKECNDLNQQMIYQSLQFVNFSLNLVAPQPEHTNYSPSGSKNTSAYSTGLFNSKA